MSFSSRSLLSLARSALRLLSGAGAGGTGSSASPRPTSTSSPTRGRTRSKPQSPTSVPKKPSPGRKQSPSSNAAPSSSKSGKAAPSKSGKAPSSSSSKARASSGKPAAPSSYPGDYRGSVTPRYAPSPDGSPDPGEVVWAWVPYEDDYSQGKDRPVLLIGRSGSRLLALMMTTRDRNNGRDSDPDYVDVGTGSWDSQGRPSEVKIDRVLQLDPASVRRQGAVLSPAAFERVRKAFADRA